MFYYPKKFGSGEVWRWMVEALGERLRLNCRVETLDVSSCTINGEIEADTLVNTAP